MGEPFLFRKVLFLVEATGQRAATLDELLRVVAVIDPRSVSFHMHREFLAHRFVHTEWPNDFAWWTARVLGDEVLGERLANLVVFTYRSLEALRARIAHIVGEHLLAYPDASQLRAPRGRELYFCSARPVVMECAESAHDLEGLVRGLGTVPESSIFFHLFETRFDGTGHRDNDFAEWIRCALGEHEVARRVANIDPYMCSLEGARRRLLAAITPAITARRQEAR
jgi:hypothetical protein